MSDGNWDDLPEEMKYVTRIAAMPSHGLADFSLAGNSYLTDEHIDALAATTTGLERQGLLILSVNLEAAAKQLEATSNYLSATAQKIRDQLDEPS